MDDLQLKDPGSGRPGYELDDLVDDMEDTYSKLSELDHCISLEELAVSLIQLNWIVMKVNICFNRRIYIVQ